MPVAGGEICYIIHALGFGLLSSGIIGLRAQVALANWSLIPDKFDYDSEPADL
ncbi:hypothetical protein [Roseovarius sp. EL26]|uniref:hypothetical protein n=1 Tax=Roseovarius sp. EL26 TaxID=2126672 RepID=UPI0013C4A511|nr:hypothetical protein [Roseovarius sp. EL26]